MISRDEKQSSEWFMKTLMRSVERKQFNERPEIIVGKIKAFQKSLGTSKHAKSPPNARKRRKRNSFPEVKFVLLSSFPKLSTLSKLRGIVVQSR